MYFYVLQLDHSEVEIHPFDSSKIMDMVHEDDEVERPLPFHDGPVQKHLPSTLEGKDEENG